MQQTKQQSLEFRNKMCELLDKMVTLLLTEQATLNKFDMRIEMVQVLCNTASTYLAMYLKEAREPYQDQAQEIYTKFVEIIRDEIVKHRPEVRITDPEDNIPKPSSN